MTTLAEVERLAFELPVDDRAKLASHLLESLPPVLADDDGIEEALRRDAEMDRYPERSITLQELNERVRKRRSA